MILRIITALVLAPVVIFLTLKLPTPWFATILLSIFIAGLMEWSRLSLDAFWHFLVGAVAMIVGSVLSWLFPQLMIWICFVVAVFWGYLVLDLWQTGMNSKTSKPVIFIQGIFILLAAWCALVILHGDPDFGPIWVIAFMLVIWAADSFAYFVGKAFGKRKLAPDLSPGKSIEGALGGMLGAGVIGCILGLFVLGHRTGEVTFFAWILAALLAALVSIAGDLYQSRLKRRAGVKDSGALLPGHGGILDRIDGLIAGAPVATSILILLK